MKKLVCNQQSKPAWRGNTLREESLQSLSFLRWSRICSQPHQGRAQMPYQRSSRRTQGVWELQIITRESMTEVTRCKTRSTWMVRPPKVWLPTGMQPAFQTYMARTPRPICLEFSDNLKDLYRTHRRCWPTAQKVITPKTLNLTKWGGNLRYWEIPVINLMTLKMENYYIQMGDHTP